MKHSDTVIHTFAVKYRRITTAITAIIFALSVSACKTSDESPLFSSEFNEGSCEEQTDIVCLRKQNAATVNTAPVRKIFTRIGESLASQGAPLILDATTSENVFTKRTKEWDGWSLYLNRNDEPGFSTCTDIACVNDWPPFLALDNDAATYPFTIIERNDGSRQWALRDLPLYFHRADAGPGRDTGNLVNQWRIAQFAPTQTTQHEVIGTTSTLLSAAGIALTGQPLLADSYDIFTTTVINKHGFSLYTQQGSEDPTTSCNRECLDTWKPLLADTDETATAPYSLIVREVGDGIRVRQWAYDGQPLYFYEGDSQPGDQFGASIEGWTSVLSKPWKTNAQGELVASGVVDIVRVDNRGEYTVSIAKDGFALYTFDEDLYFESSRCDSDNCLNQWLPLIAHTSNTTNGEFTTIERDSGLKQWAYNGKPIYLSATDRQAGDKTLQDNWLIIDLINNPPTLMALHPASSPEKTEADVNSEQIQVIFDRYCTDCHSGEFASANLDLSAESSFFSLVSRSSRQRPDRFLVQPYSAENSYLIQKLKNAPDMIGISMPAGDPLLDDAVISRLERWINQGANL